MHASALPERRCAPHVVRVPRQPLPGPGSPFCANQLTLNSQRQTGVSTGARASCKLPIRLWLGWTSERPLWVESSSFTPAQPLSASMQVFRTLGVLSVALDGRLRLVTNTNHPPPRALVAGADRGPIAIAAMRRG
jgi:hypothetical protein